ncbi:mas-related G-protein coupled receptor member A6-like [Sparus aurata]|uniref:mas-related G-protein coupled receptor member A6-like n=1 Tax=Sparus aurata TaxID=8175 RepID=UPI0011C13E60|nr:mas-related G-protein coupled receptor member A6-like [Sparus aurata]
MADFNINNASQDYSYDYNTTNSYSEYSIEVKYVVTCVITSIGLFLTLLAIYSLYTMVRKDHVVPIYVINILISDLIQLCCLIPLVTGSEDMMLPMLSLIHLICLMASIGFMVCIALERYLVIACPLWYRFRHTIKFSVVLCVMIWVLSSVLCALTLWVLQDGYITEIIMGTFLLLPLPLFIFFLGGTIRALSASRVPSDEKQRIVGIFVLVLLIYTLLFLPAIIWFMADGDIHDQTLSNLVYVFVQLSPLADSLLYVFMRKGTIDKLLASVCCCRMDSNDITSPTV